MIDYNNNNPMNTNKKERKKYIFTQKTYKTTLPCYYYSSTPFNEHESINLIGLRLCYGRG